jgi:hypothetical protein
MYTGNLDTSGRIHDFQWIAEIDSFYLLSIHCFFLPAHEMPLPIKHGVMYQFFLLDTVRHISNYFEFLL